MSVTAEQIAEARAALLNAQKRLADLLRRCAHEVLPQTPDRWAQYGSASCSICGQSFGWYCPESPDRTCHYFSHGGQITLITGVLVKVPDDHDEEYETEDACIFCGDPEERK